MPLENNFLQINSLLILQFFLILYQIPNTNFQKNYFYLKVNKCFLNPLNFLGTFFQFAFFFNCRIQFSYCASLRQPANL